MRIDAHQHFWKLDRGDYDWLTPEAGVLYQDFFPEHLLPRLKEVNINQTILVQATPTVEETEYMLDLYKRNDFIAGVVGWLDLGSPRFPEWFDKFNRLDGFVGIRPMLQDLPDDRWILKEQVKKNLAKLAEADFPLDILVFPRHLPHIVELLEEFPDLRAVIDHAAKPYIREQQIEPWKEQMAQIAGFKNIMCKLSGFITEADHQHWTNEDLLPYIRHVIQVFGTDRVMFGSDWPVCLLAGSYSQVYDALKAGLPEDLSEEEEALIFGKNAARFYKLET